MPSAPCAETTRLLLAMMVCCNVSPQATCTLIALFAPEALPVMVLPVISTWSQTLPVGDVTVGPQFGQIWIPVPCIGMFVITRLLMVVLEKVVPVIHGPRPKTPGIGRIPELDTAGHPTALKSQPVESVAPGHHINRQVSGHAGERDIGLSVAIDVAVDG